MVLQSLKGISQEELRRIVEEIQDTEAVDYSGKNGGICPVCGAEKCRVSASAPWCGSVRERFHKCRGCGLRFKSVETE